MAKIGRKQFTFLYIYQKHRRNVTFKKTQCEKNKNVDDVKGKRKKKNLNKGTGESGWWYMLTENVCLLQCFWHTMIQTYIPTFGQDTGFMLRKYLPGRRCLHNLSGSTPRDERSNQ